MEKIIQSSRDISEILAVDLIACNNYQNGSDAAKTINCPTLFILGELDKMANLESGKKFANLVKDSTTYINLAHQGYAAPAGNVIGPRSLRRCRLDDTQSIRRHRSPV